MAAQQQSQSYLIGTRGSLLARTQSGLILDALSAHPLGAHYQLALKTIQTEGDQRQDKPLWQYEGKDFFTKEIDQAIAQRQVDCAVHSYKDLGSERPPSLRLAAITERHHPYDILLYRRSLRSEWQDRQEIRIGTSSPRRQALIQAHLRDFLPPGPAKLQVLSLRGNVNTRLAKLQAGEFDMIALAWAGLERLAQGLEGQRELAGLLQGLQYAILPASYFPPAAAQGALGVECHRDLSEDSALGQMLAALHHPLTAREVGLERSLFQHYGGGCHLAVGVHVKEFHQHQLVIERGEWRDRPINRRRLLRPSPLPPPPRHYFVGMPRAQGLGDRYIEKKLLPMSEQSFAANAFITSSYGIEALKWWRFEGDLLASGVRTWKELARRGHWVQGSADSMGHGEILKMSSSPVLKLMRTTQEWKVLTHPDSHSPVGSTLGCYDYHLRPPTPEYEAQLAGAQFFFWTSFRQYQTFVERFPFIEGRQHACGLGKTWDRFRREGLAVFPFINVQHFLQWIEHGSDELI